MQKSLLILLFLPAILFSQYNLKVIVENVSNSNGNVSIAVYNNEHGFLEFNHVFLSNSSKAIKGITIVNLAHVPTGTYALAVFHDENFNEKLDTNFLGMPKESIGFSNAKMKTFGPPSFNDCSFKLESNKEITVTIK